MPWGSAYNGTDGKTANLPVPTGGGWGSKATVTPPAPPAKQGGGGGLLGAIEGGAHWVAQKSELAAHDIKSIPGGVVDVGKLLGQGTAAALTGNTKALDQNAKDIKAFGKAQAEGAATALQHPLRDPFQTLTVLAPIGHGVGSGVARTGAAAEAVRAGEGVGGAVKALAAKPEMPPRLITVGDAQVPLHASLNPAVRAAQALHDAIIQKAIDTNPQGKILSKVGSYATKRVGGSLDETARLQQRMRAIPADALDQATKRLAPTSGRVPGSGVTAAVTGLKRVNQAALELTSANTMPDAAAAYHLDQAAQHGARAQELTAASTQRALTPNETAALAEAKAAVPRNQAVARLYQTVHDRGLLTQNEHGDVIVNHIDHPQLAQADVALARVQGKGDAILTRYGIRSPEDLQQRVSGPGRIRAGGSYLHPQEADAMLRQTRSMLAQVEKSAQEATDKLAVSRSGTPQTRAAESEYARASARADKALVSGSALSQARKLGDQAFSTATRALDTRVRTRDAAAKASDANAMLVREERLAQIGWERYQRGEISDSALAGTQERVQKLRDAYEQHATDLIRFRKAEADGMKAQADQVKARADLAAARAGNLERAASIRAASENTLRAARNEQQTQLLALKKDLESLSQWRENLAQAHAQITEEKGSIVGGENARPGRGFVSYATEEPKQPASPAAASPGSVVGEAKSPITSKAFTGAGIEKGLIPSDVTGAAARHYRSIVRFVNTTERRNAAIATGSDIRKTARDVLVKVPGEEHAQIPQALEEQLGRKKSTVDDVAGLHAALEAYRHDLVPGLADQFVGDSVKQAPVGTTAADAAAARNLDAPGGYKWVDRNVLGDLAKPSAGPRGKVARPVDAINSAVTAATVYFKIGHAGTRLLTNEATNIIQGSAGPLSIKRAIQLRNALSPEDQLRALAASGQHGFAALPHEGTSKLARFAGHGANAWAKYADARFRFNSIAYEARKAGFDTPEKFHEMLNKLEDGGQGLNAAQWAKIDWVAKRANRAGIAYDRLNNFERNYIARGIWFYPWVKGATMFAGHTLSEHPYKAAALGSAGVEGRQAQTRELGVLPSYEGGLFKIGSADKQGRPLVADFSTFSPFSTPADLLNAVARPGEISGFLNPVVGAGDQLINGLNSHGGKSTSPIKDALATVGSTTPEAQILTAFLNRHKDQSKKMFPASPELAGTLSPLLRALIGPGTPRRINLAAGASSAARERAGR